MGFSAMLAEEYIINCINFTQQRFGLTNHGISAPQKALTVVASVVRHPKNFDGQKIINYQMY